MRAPSPPLKAPVLVMVARWSGELRQWVERRHLLGELGAAEASLPDRSPSAQPQSPERVALV